MNLKNALATEGWMKPAELKWLAKKAAKLRSIVEVGSWMGGSTKAMADGILGAYLCKMRPNPVLGLHESRLDAIKSLLCSGRNHL